MFVSNSKIPCTILKFPVQIVPSVILGKAAELSIPGKGEHLRNTKTAAKVSRIANHTWSNNHAIDFENASIIDKGTFRTRKTLESWHTRVTPNADNNSSPLPGQHSF